ncbi:BgTH12-05363 [Blumeria graminis f. sp. triticale]|uniref:BgTH12-05363 n=1 Tax=Blumeria graminis f. sp. triticale TaxID=1689686 RepID=A0A9W4D1U7_BLUGR|nr:BgTH12-05363 [Blumeria graminis f. sp. triticale]
MACVVAFLLKSWIRTTLVDQITLVANNAQESIYEMYEPRDGKFPKVGGDIQMTNVDVSASGTYISVYCSKTLKSRDIVNKISRGMVDLNIQPNNRLFPDSEQFHLCLESLADMDKKLCNPYLLNVFKRYISWSKINIFICPPEIIVRMALHYGITVVGKYQNFVPTKKERKKDLSINADKQFKISELVQDRFVFRGKNWSVNSVALAWYHGHPHLFQWKDDHGWLPLTRISQEHEYGALLFYYVLGNDHEIWNSRNSLSTEINSILESVQWQEHEKHIIDLVVSGSAEVPLKVVDDLGKLKPTAPFGLIGEKL